MFVLEFKTQDLSLKIQNLNQNKLKRCSKHDVDPSIDIRITEWKGLSFKTF